MKARPAEWPLEHVCFPHLQLGMYRWFRPVRSTPENHFHLAWLPSIECRHNWTWDFSRRWCEKRKFHRVHHLCGWFSGARLARRCRELPPKCSSMNAFFFPPSCPSEFISRGSLICSVDRCRRRRCVHVRDCGGGPVSCSSLARHIGQYRSSGSVRSVRVSERVRLEMEWFHCLSKNKFRLLLLLWTRRRSLNSM